MRNRTLIIKNISHEGPGLLSEILEYYNLSYDIIDLSKRIEFPEINRYQLIIIMGGPDSVNFSSQKILKVKEFVRLALDKNIPIFGICLGAQLLADALGAEVYKNPVQEIGFMTNDTWYTIKLTESGLKDPLFKGINDNFIVFQLHGETFKLTNETLLLGTGEFCKNQIIKVGETNYGFQFHFELTEELFNNILLLAPELINYNKDKIRKNYNIIKENFIQRGRHIFKNYLKIINFI
ncbi:MAG: type 1 glutamine amidotransferase [Candidatus Hermodarchaeota archaeon]